jgi:hypothetical protein
VDPALRLGGRDPLDAMGTGLKLEARKHAATRDAADDLLVAAMLAGAFAQHLDGEALGLGVARVHAQ